MLNLLQGASLDSLSDLCGIGGKQVRRDFPKEKHFVPFDVFPLALGEAKEEHGPNPYPIGNDHAVPARSPLPFTGDALFDQPSAQIGVDHAPFRPLDSFAQALVRYPLAPDESRKPLRLEDSQAVS